MRDDVYPILRVFAVWIPSDTLEMICMICIALEAVPVADPYEISRLLTI